MVHKRYAQAVEQAKANSRHFRHPWLVFSDTSGNWRSERYKGQIIDYGMERVLPSGRIENVRLPSDSLAFQLAPVKVMQRRSVSKAAKRPR